METNIYLTIATAIKGGASRIKWVLLGEGEDNLGYRHKGHVGRIQYTAENVYCQACSKQV